jgi:hypothetical protein
MRRRDLRWSVRVLLATLLSAYLCAAVFIISLQLSLPRTDLAYGQSLSQTLSDPFVLVVGTTGAAVAGLLAFQLLCLRQRDLVRCGLFVVGLTMLWIVVATALAGRPGLLGAPLVALAALLFCRFTHLSFFQPHDESISVA